MNKKELRVNIISKRDMLKNRDVLDSRILLELINTKEYINAKNIFIYIGFGSEINTKEYIKEFFKEGKTVLVPRTEIKSRKMEAIKITSLDNLKESKYGILEPSLNEKPFNEDEIDLIIIPGVAFDLNGNRLGYGGGFYDRFLSRTKAYKIALCYDFQLLNKIETEEHDIPTDLIITEKRTVLCYNRKV